MYTSSIVLRMPTFLKPFRKWLAVDNDMCRVYCGIGDGSNDDMREPFLPFWERSLDGFE